MGVSSDSSVERVRQWASRLAIGLTLVLLVAGLTLYYSGSTALSMTFFRSVFFVLVAMPIVAVIAVLLEEVRRRDWTFAAATVVVLGLIAYSIFR